MKSGAYFEMSTDQSIKAQYINHNAFPGLLEFYFNKSRYLMFCKNYDLPAAAKIVANKYLKNIDIFYQHNVWQRLYIDIEYEDRFECTGFGMSLPSNAAAIEYFMNHLGELEGFLSQITNTYTQALLRDVEFFETIQSNFATQINVGTSQKNTNIIEKDNPYCSLTSRERMPRAFKPWEPC